MVMDAVAEVVIYKLSEIGDHFVRVCAIMAMIGFGFGLVSFVLTPWLDKQLRTLHRGTRRGWGILGEVVLFGTIAVGLFALHYQLYVHGPQTLLPPAWRNE